MYLLDTNHISQLILGSELVRKQITSVGEQNVAISSITQGEMFYMAYKSDWPERNLRLSQGYLADIDIYSINDEIANLYGRFKAELIRYYGPKERKKLRKTKLESVGISDNDLWIACTALYYKRTVVSTDRDFAWMQSVMKFSLTSWL